MSSLQIIFLSPFSYPNTVSYIFKLADLNVNGALDMEIRFFIKVLATIILLDFLIMVILEKYLQKGILEMDMSVSIYRFEAVLKFTTWIFLAIFIFLLILIFIVLRKIRK